MTSGPLPSAGQPAPEDALDDDALEDDDEFDDEPEHEPKRGWPLGMLLGIAIGIWVGRWFYRLPDGFENLAGVVLALATALIAAGIYRRWVRRQFEQARARRRR